MAAMEKTAKKEYEKSKKKVKVVEQPKVEEALTEDQGEAIAKNMLDEFLEEQKPKPAAPPKKAKKVAVAHKKVVHAQK